VRLATCLLLAIVLALLTTACEDDTTIINTVYDHDSTKVLALGEVVLRPYVDFSVNLLQVYAEPNPVDSVKFADSLCTLADVGYYATANQINYRADYINMDDSLRLGSGDVASVEIFQGDSITTVEVPMLKSPDDSVVFDFSATDTVVSLGEPVIVSWEAVTGADWYGMFVYNWYDSLGNLEVRSWYVRTTATTYTFPADDHPDDSRYSIRIVAVTGPIPDSGIDNVSGPGLVGTIYCATRDTQLSVRVGQGDGHQAALFDESTGQVFSIAELVRQTSPQQANDR